MKKKITFAGKNNKSVSKRTMGSNRIIGEKIRNIREMKRISVGEIAERAGLEENQIIRIERNEDFPSLAPLIKIARVLGVRLGTFLDDQQELGPVICRRESLRSREGIGFTNNAVTKHKYMSYHSLSADKSGRHMEPFLIDVEPAGDTGFVFSTHEGEEFIYVIEGTIEINYGQNTYLLHEGDSIYYDSIVAHHVHAGDDKPARILGIVYTPC
jgi:transcriptional regulator with XRE-family HTH domain